MPITYSKTCEQCKQPFAKRLNQREAEPRFCSKECRNENQRGRAWGRGAESGHAPPNKGARYSLPQAHRIPRDPDLLRSLYAQFPTGVIATRFGVTLASLCKVMTELGIDKRTASENAKFVMAHRSPEQRKAFIAAAQASIRGNPRSHESLCRRAQTVQRVGKLSGHEQAVFDLLAARDLHPIPLFAVDKYNIDLAFPDRMIGFEITSGGWHRTPKKVRTDEAKRATLRDIGWTIVDLNTQRTPPEEAARRIIDFIAARPA